MLLYELFGLNGTNRILCGEWRGVNGRIGDGYVIAYHLN